MRIGHRLAPIAVLLGVMAAIAPTAAVAAFDPLASGTVSIDLDKRFEGFLRRNDLRLSPLSPAAGNGGRLVLPVSGGKFDPTIDKGTVETSGALAFEGSHRKLPLRDVAVKANHVPVVAKVGGGQLKVATSNRVTVTRNGFGNTITIGDLDLTAKAITRLNKKLRPGFPFYSGQAVGRLIAKTRPETVTVLPGRRALLSPAPAILEKFRSLFVSLNPIAPAELIPGPVFTFPMVMKGTIAPDASSGIIRVGGELEFLQLGGGQIFWQEDWFDLGGRATSAEVNLQPSPPFAGKLGRVVVLELSGTAAIDSEPKARTLAVSGQPLILQASTAEAFNQAFAEGKPVFTPGEPFGSLSFEAVGQ